MDSSRLDGTNPTGRFTDKVDDYVKYRPSYPKELIETLFREAKITNGSVIADVGSGTGIFSELMLSNIKSTGLTAKLFAVEPNESMRRSAETWLLDQERYSKDRFESVDGSAETTTLPSDSVDLITAAQAFHWFRLEPTKKEWERIIKPNGKIGLVWNDRRVEGDQFQVAYDALIRKHCKDVEKALHSNVDKEQITQLFDIKDLKEFSFSNGQIFDLDGLKGRLKSSSYCPKEGEPNFVPIMKDLEDAFHKHKRSDGKLEFKYNTRLFLATIKRIVR
eukprot:TRINITY_DN300_c0_g1_i1.p1 TRINITY_DN300_c0_g1~~TRINITY_DN300_c0_g1_i1.p1  ORF type:complete len:287 (-),score=31.78 TRINITY_DN300_c0_g1_i1:27-857(-)